MTLADKLDKGVPVSTVNGHKIERRRPVPVTEETMRLHERAQHTPSIEPGRIRVSSVQGDVAEPFWASLIAEGKTVRVYLDGVEQPLADTADEQRGYIVRPATDSRGGIFVNTHTDQVIRETMFGEVKVVIEDR